MGENILGTGSLLGSFDLEVFRGEGAQGPLSPVPTGSHIGKPKPEKPRGRQIRCPRSEKPIRGPRKGLVDPENSIEQGDLRQKNQALAGFRPVIAVTGH